MQIFVNDQKLEAELAGERTLKEVYEQIDRWSSENKKYILSLQVDREDVSLQHLDAMPVEGVDRIDFYIGDEYDMLISTIDEMDRYVDQIGSTLFELTELREKEITDLREGVHWIRQIMKSVGVILRIDLEHSGVAMPGAEEEESRGSIASVLDRMEKGIEEIAHSNNRDSIETFLQTLRSFKYFVMRLQLQLRAMHTGFEELVEMVEEFEREIPGLTAQAVHINERLNTGADREAMEALEGLTQRLNVYLSALFAMDYRLSGETGEGLANLEVKGVPLNVRAGDMTELLQDLSSALEESDLVAVGDILEYELTEKLNDLVPYMAKIRQLMVAKK